MLLVTQLSLFSICVFSQHNNMNLEGHLDYNNLHQTGLNDVWGYVDEFGNEYVLVGARKGVSVVDISDPTNPQEVFWVPESESVWRDLKVFGDYAYITTEGHDGLMIIDLSPLPNGTITSVYNFFGPTNNEWQSAHNLWIDENGIAYIFGANRGNGGVIMYDLNTNPIQPNEVGTFDTWYVHDGFVRDNTMMLAHINDGFFSVVDVSDFQNPVVLATQITPSSFAHNIWPSDDGDYVFTTDEVSGAYVASYDISDLQNIFEVDKIQSSPGVGIVPHNTHFHNDLLFTSYYADGVVIHDAKDPTNLVEVANYDTYPGNSNQTIGCWGVYPFFPSGTVVATDMVHGLFVLSYNYIEAARVSGKITDEMNGSEIEGVKAEIIGNNQHDFSNINGNYGTGIAQDGEKIVRFTKYGYETKEVAVNFINGQNINLDVELTPLTPFYSTIKVVDEFDQPIFNANVRVKHNDVVLDVATDFFGEANFTLYYEDNYGIIAGKWEYVTHCDLYYIDQNTVIAEIVLKEGYYDDFSFDYGWMSFGSATAGLWERAVPNGVGQAGDWSNPNIDSPIDCDDYAYVTGNEASFLDNVTDGTVFLLSPVMNISAMSDPYIYFEKWFYNKYGPLPPNDSLIISISNGQNSVIIDITDADSQVQDEWTPVSVRILDFFNDLTTVQITVFTSDNATSENIVEAGLDHFMITERSVLSVESHKIKNDVIIFPNPANQLVNIQTEMEDVQKIIIFNSLGKKVYESNLSSSTHSLDVSLWESGVYFVRVDDIVKKLIVK